MRTGQSYSPTLLSATYVPRDWGRVFATCLPKHPYAPDAVGVSAVADLQCSPLGGSRIRRRSPDRLSKLKGGTLEMWTSPLAPTDCYQHAVGDLRGRDAGADDAGDGMLAGDDRAVRQDTA